jgi:RNA polymerase sigma-70 factor (ECF subfamily)
MDRGKKDFVYDRHSKDFIIELYIKYREEMIKISFSKLNDWHEAEDAVEEAFINIAKNYSKIINSKDYEIKKYIIVTVTNTSYKILNKKKANIYSDIEIIEEHSPPSACAEEIAISEVSYKELKKSIDELSPRYKQILNMKHEGYSNKEISEKLNVKIDTIRVMLMRIRAYLKRGGLKDE